MLYTLIMTYLIPLRHICRCPVTTTSSFDTHCISCILLLKHNWLVVIKVHLPLVDEWQGDNLRYYRHRVLSWQ